MKTLKVKSALVSGAYFYTGWDDHLAGCAGSVTESLRSVGVKVDISKYSWSDHKEMKTLGYITKETGKEGERQRLASELRKGEAV